MNLLKYDSTVKVLDGYSCFHTITEFRGVNWSSIENDQLKGIYILNSPITVINETGSVDVNSIEYLGIHPLSRIVFGTLDLIIHKKQRLLVSLTDDLGSDPEWKTVEEIGALLSSTALSLSTEFGNLNITEVIHNVEENHLYNLILPTNDSFYIQHDIKIK